jgi:DUF1707 SHOCT-like domain
MDGAGRDYPPGDLRVSDADRDRALRELSEAFQVGRITADELDQRSGQALSARTGNELTALLADLPVERGHDGPGESVPADGTAAPDRARRLLATRTAFAAAVAALCFAAVATENAVSHGPTLQQREMLRQALARQRVSIHALPAPGFNWAGTITPAVIAVLLVVLVVCLRVRMAHAGRR